MLLLLPLVYIYSCTHLVQPIHDFQLKCMMGFSSNTSIPLTRAYLIIFLKIFFSFIFFSNLKLKTFFDFPGNSRLVRVLLLLIIFYQKQKVNPLIINNKKLNRMLWNPSRFNGPPHLRSSRNSYTIYIYSSSTWSSTIECECLGKFY